MQAVRQRLKPRACADAIGWTQCVMSQVLGRDTMIPVITAHLRRYSMGLMGAHSSSASLALITWGDTASSALGGHQHGIQQEDGAAQFALKISRRAECHPTHAFLQYDLSDAFNSISREDVWQGLNQ
eukprot:3145151-Amphidinium_carterae.1